MRERTAYWFIMVVLLLILFLIGATLNIRAQDYWTFWYETPAGVYGIKMIDGEGWETYMEGAVPEEFVAASLTCAADFYIRPTILDDYQFAERLDQCERPERQAPPTEAGIECLGIAVDGSGTFTVDGNDYRYDRSLSFVVGLDDLWRWELYIDGTLFISFEQTERGNCHVVLP